VRSRIALETIERGADELVNDDEAANALDYARAASDELTRYADNWQDGQRRFRSYLAEAECHAGLAVSYTSEVYLGASSIRGDPGVAATAASNVVRYTTAAQLDPEGLAPDLGNSEVPRAAKDAESAAQAQLLRCIFGNPFRPVAFDPEWRTSTVVQLARGIYDDRDFDRLPILADALQDAGCNNADVLNHCRQPGPHARGCWVVDLVLGKH
jgi:hypothetical protein